MSQVQVHLVDQGVSCSWVGDFSLCWVLVTGAEAAIDHGLLIVEDFANDREAETFVNYASVLGDDGESATCAIAYHREWAIATDDRQAISFFQREAPHLQILSSLEIIKHWSEVSNVASAELRNVLSDIRIRGRYIPHRNHPLLSWWQDLME